MSEAATILIFGGRVITIVVSRLLAASFIMAAAVSAVPLHAKAETVVSSLRVKVSGEIAPSCGLTQTEASVTFDLGDSQTGGTRSSHIRLPFSIDCNSPFSLVMASRNGALAFTEPARIAAGFRTAISYSTEVMLPDALSAGAGCDSEAMSRGGCERDVAARDGVLGDGYITLTVLADPQPLLKGVYADTLTLVARPRLGGDETL